MGAVKEFQLKSGHHLIKIPSYRLISPLLKKMSPKDAPVLASAKLGQADYLITEDKGGFPEIIAKPIRIISPANFLNELEEMIAHDE